MPSVQGGYILHVHAVGVDGECGPFLCMWWPKDRLVINRVYSKRRTYWRYPASC